MHFYDVPKRHEILNATYQNKCDPAGTAYRYIEGCAPRAGISSCTTSD